MSWDMMLEPIVLLLVALGVMIYTAYTLFTMIDYYKLHRSRSLLPGLFGASFIYSVGQWSTCVAIETVLLPQSSIYSRKETLLFHCIFVTCVAISALIWSKLYRYRYSVSAGLLALGMLIPLMHILYDLEIAPTSDLYIHSIFLILICIAGVTGSFYWYALKHTRFYKLKAGIILAATVCISSFLVVLAFGKEHIQVAAPTSSHTIDLLLLLLMFLGAMICSMGLQWWISQRRIQSNCNKYKQLVEQFADTTALIKGENWEYVNPSGLRLFQAYYEQDLVGKPIYSMLDPRDHERLSECLKQKDVSQMKPVELRWRTFEGEYRYTEFTLRECAELGEEYRQVFMKDILKLRREEEEKMIAARLSATKHLAAGIAHEIRNPLTSIKGFLHLIMTGRLNKNNYYTIIKQELLGIETLINTMLMIVKPQKTDYMLLDITQIIQGEITNVEEQWAATDIHLQYRIDSVPVYVRGVEQQLRIVLHNLLKHAAQSMQKEGNIHIKLYTDHVEEIAIVIQDEGEGITEEQILRFGQPYFANNEHGTGIEFLVSYTIIEHHGGRISVESQPGLGTTYTIWLPRRKQMASTVNMLHSPELITNKT